MTRGCEWSKLPTAGLSLCRFRPSAGLNARDTDRTTTAYATFEQYLEVHTEKAMRLYFIREKSSWFPRLVKAIQHRPEGIVALFKRQFRLTS
jgi:hypothetical protein